MNTLKPILLGLSLAVAGSSVAAAQETATIPKVLQITREYTKPYKDGMAHDKTESAFVAAMTRAKFPAYYVALHSLTGKARALFLTQYASFADWEADNKIVDTHPALAGELERAGLADGELLDEIDSAVYIFNPELSYHPHPDISHARYMEVYVFKVRAGHGHEWDQLAKMVKDGHEKAGDSAHWAMFEAAYGTEDGTYIALSAHNSMADIDTGFAEDKKFHDAMGEEGMKNLDKLFGETVETSHTELFSINPKQSYVNPDWIKADPDFWKPKPASEEKKANP
jgi:hypothetical protein